MKIIDMRAERAEQLAALSVPERELHALMVKALGDRELVSSIELN
jgi:hypothetical protein